MKKRIMVVGNDPSTLMVIRATLESAKYEVVTAQSEEACLDLVEKEKPDLILLDTIFPCLSGLKTLRRLRTEGATDSTKIAMLTFDNNPETGILEFRGLVSGHILRLFEKDELIRWVGEFLG